MTVWDRETFDMPPVKAMVLAMHPKQFIWNFPCVSGISLQPL